MDRIVRNDDVTPAGAWDLACRVESGGTDLAAVGKQITDLATEAFERRLQAVAAQVSELDQKKNRARIKKLIEGLAHDGKALLPFAAFRELLEGQLAGIVFTAHPTFGFSEEGWRAAGAILAGEKPTLNAEAVAPPKTSPTLDEELRLANEAIGQTREAIRKANRIALGVAAALYPEDWRVLVPTFATVATWVGFDLDGRTDIGWSKSLEFRYLLAVDGLQALEQSLDRVSADGDAAVQIKIVRAGLESFRANFTLGLDALVEIDSGEGLADLNRLALEKRPEKDAALRAIDGALDALMAMDMSSEALIDVAALRAEWQGLGLGLSHIHFRLNAVQLHNAIRPEIELERSPDQSASRRHYLAAVTELLESVKPVNIHYGTVAAEQTTARRLFMLAAQFEKHFDGRTPIRLLVAESDTPFTLLTALYYARLFGVEDHLQISPLFETAVGLKRGDRVIGELVDNPHFLAYIRAQGRFCVQLGFSDSGRYIGQPAATLAIERFKLRLIRMWKQKNLGDIQLVFFDTHGESVGRGAHPAGLKDRFLYTHSPEVRRHLDALSAPHKHEVSFQGGDGYLRFRTPDLALAALADLLDVRLRATPEPAPDPFYEERGWSLDFFLTLTEFQGHLEHHPGYVGLLDTFAPQLLYPTGSRATRRQAKGSAAPRAESISQIRAIPHNAILQQLGYMANTLGGIGTAIGRTPERFLEMRDGSDRLQSIMSLVQAARVRSDIHIFVAYTALLDPGYWLDLADGADSLAQRKKLRRVSKILEQAFDHQAISSMVRKLRHDAGKLDDHLGPPPPDAALGELHSMRLALIHLVFLKTTEVPRFSSRLDISLGDLLTSLLRLDIPEAVEELRAIFPASPEGAAEPDYGEDATYTSAAATGYAAEHEAIFDPLEQLHSLILAASSAISHRIGAVG
ncbi:MAG: phosphoenolpyruvate carboxylase [Proteobacteria bacterium]|nr:phosphoenolpyruvate carboxylase [Pseudomonadota bacterium]